MGGPPLWGIFVPVNVDLVPLMPASESSPPKKKSEVGERLERWAPAEPGLRGRAKKKGLSRFNDTAQPQKMEPWIAVDDAAASFSFPSFPSVLVSPGG